MYKLLIADDEKIIRESVSEMIPWADYNIQITACCKNGLEALDAIMDTAPDIVMTDIRMPGMDGLELIHKIQSLDSHIRFIILTGYPEFEYARQALRYGVQEYLLKPISEEQIVEAVKNVKDSLNYVLDPSMNALISNLIRTRKNADKEHAGELLAHFFRHYNTGEELCSYGLQLLIELHTNSSPMNVKFLSHFTEDLLLEQDLDKLRNHIITNILELLFASESVKTPLSDIVKKYVSKHINDENLSLKFIAENVLYINVNYLSRCFTKQTGENFSNYLNRTRIEKARKMLCQTGLKNIHNIAEAVGFGANPQYFSQVFKKYTGMTPSTYVNPNDNTTSNTSL